MQACTDLALPVGREQIDRLQAAMLKFPQTPQKTDHYFADRVYCRTIWSPAPTLIVGKAHKTDHLYGVLTGVVKVTINGLVHEVNATRDGPQFFRCPVGTKRSILVIEDAWRMNVHANPDDLTNLDELEEIMIEPTASPFLADNTLKALT